MKKAGVRILIFLVVAAIGIGAWFCGYHSRKNLDNIPSKALIVSYLTEKEEDYAAEKIHGYSADDFIAVWGEPDGELFGMYGYIWETESAFFVVYFDSEGNAEGIRLGERSETS